jgi:hypothetical protein
MARWLLLHAIGWLPLFSEPEPLLYFLDKYAMIMVGGAKAMGKYYKANKSKTLLDKLTVSDIAYSILVYKNVYDVWMEETVKVVMCETDNEKRAFKCVAINKYHVQRGYHIALYQDGWTSEEHEYFGSICGEIRDMMMAGKLCSTLQSHWAVYAKKYHKYSYICNKLLMGVNEDHHVDMLEQANDDDCVVLLPGEDDDDNINNDDSYAESSDDESEDRPHKKQHIKAV